jgi:cobalamin transport system substrate-binding protein
VQRAARGRPLPVSRRALVLALLVACCGRGAAPRTAGPPARVVSLAPSATELVYALGAGARLVGVCGQCDRPAEVARVPRVGGYLAPSVEATLAVRPDLVIAVPSPGNREAVRAIERAGIRVLVVRDRTLDDLWASIAALAEALGMPAEGARLATDLRQRLDGVRARLAGVAPRRVLVVVDHNPLVVVGGGTLQDELITIAGGTNVVRDVGSAWPTITLELVVARAPEVIVDAGMGNEGAAAALFAGLTTVPAVRDGRIVGLRDDAFFRAGPRVADAAAALADLIHPGVLAPDGASREAPPG